MKGEEKSRNSSAGNISDILLKHLELMVMP